MMELYPWQKDAFERFVQLEQSERLPHALLLSGPAGSGKTEFAEYLTHYLMCQDSTKRPCFTCQHCSLVQSHAHPDYRWVGIEVDQKTKKEKKDISIAQIRELKSFAGLSQSGATYKVILITPADALNQSSSNSLLKLLEEPQGNTVLLLVTHQVERLVATIRSRCQKLELPLPDHEISIDWLVNSHQLENAASWLKMSQGGPIAALAMAESYADSGLDYEQIVSDCLGLMFNRGSRVIETAKSWKNYPLNLLLEWQLGLTRDLIRQTNGVAIGYFENQDRYDVLQKVSDRINLHKVTVLYEYLIKLKMRADVPLRPETFREELAHQWKHGQ